MLGTTAEAFAVDDHRARKGQSFHTRASHRGQEHSRSGVVRGGIIGKILDIDTKPDFGGEVQHRVDAGEQTIERGSVAHIRLFKADTGGWQRRSILVHIGPQRIDSAYLMAAGEKFAHDMLADEACRSSQ
jgi:hypothetical protein